ncbi:sterol desaturase family protein [Legionella sp. W05-934-2]|jgi:sterol desaturase/sphingolipid hydroxylase (fatty acid hydroxylase superfamily)|uniref:sterol desaturase family protein n=1 Tax=Legionella sp. W05-934-2 TaxID=1198649 RepID=UPI0034624525
MIDWHKIYLFLIENFNQLPFFSTGERLFWGYVLGYTIISYGMYIKLPPHLKPKRFFNYLFPSQIYLHPSAKVDYVYFIWISLFSMAMLPFLALQGEVIYRASLSILNNNLGPLSKPLSVTLASKILLNLSFVLVADFIIFITHYMQHKSTILWQFHKVHHSAEVLTPITTQRMHPIDILLTFGLSVVLISGFAAIYSYLFVEQLSLVTIAGMNAFFFLFYMTIFHFRHSHIWLHFPRWLCYVFISPAQHQIHHSSLEKHLNCNYGFIFSCWDYLFGSLYIPDKKEYFPMGLHNDPAQKEMCSTGKLFWLPFTHALNLMKKDKSNKAHTHNKSCDHFPIKK